MTKKLVDAYFTSEDITPEQYIDITEQMRKHYIAAVGKSAISKYQTKTDKRNRRHITLKVSQYEADIKKAYIEGEIKSIEMFINLLIAHQKDDMDLLFGSLELAVTQKVKSALSDHSDPSKILNELIAVIESVKANYKGTKEEVQESINTFWDKPTKEEACGNIN